MAIDLDDLERRAQLLIGIDLFCLPPLTVLELVRLARVGRDTEIRRAQEALMMQGCLPMHGPELLGNALRHPAEPAHPAPEHRELDCYCSDFNSAGLPCPPGKCPNAPKTASADAGELKREP
jgi:hypothetical protein